MKKTFRGFDCVDMKRRIQEKIREDTKDMNARQFAQYMHKRIETSRFASFLKRPTSGSPGGTRSGGA
jgi:chemotaxis regulatin CheY-phosphate phosphatase CheZ